MLKDVTEKNFLLLENAKNNAGKIQELALALTKKLIEVIKYDTQLAEITLTEGHSNNVIALINTPFGEARAKYKVLLSSETEPYIPKGKYIIEKAIFNLRDEKEWHPILEFNIISSDLIEIPQINNGLTLSLTMSTAPNIFSALKLVALAIAQQD